MKNKKIIIEEHSTCLITKDELEHLNKGQDGKVFIDGKEFFLRVIDNE